MVLEGRKSKEEASLARRNLLEGIIVSKTT